MKYSTLWVDYRPMHIVTFPYRKGFCPKHLCHMTFYGANFLHLILHNNILTIALLMFFPSLYGNENSFRTHQLIDEKK